MEQKLAGRPKGSLNKVTQEVRAVLSDWAIHELRNVSALYSKLSPKEQARFITNILPYVTPRMKEVDMNVNLDSLPETQIDSIIKKLLDGEY
jgi:hypothetical protein